MTDKADEYEDYKDAQGRWQRRKVGQNTSLVDREKYDPVLKSTEKLQESKTVPIPQAKVEETGGLAGLARREAEKKRLKASGVD